MLVGELMKTLEMMKTHVQRVTPSDSLRTALDKLDLYQTPALPVVDQENRPVGIVTEGDLARAISSNMVPWRRETSGGSARADGSGRNSFDE